MFRCILYDVAPYSVVGAGMAWGGRSGVRICLGARYYSLFQNAPIDSGVHPAYFAMGTGVFAR